MSRPRCLGQILAKKENQIFSLSEINGKIGFSAGENGSTWYFVGRHYIVHYSFLLCNEKGQVVCFDPKDGFVFSKQNPIEIVFYPEFKIKIPNMDLKLEVYLKDPNIPKFDNVDPGSKSSRFWTRFTSAVFIWIFIFFILFLLIFLFISLLVKDNSNEKF